MNHVLENVLRGVAAFSLGFLLVMAFSFCTSSTSQGKDSVKVITLTSNNLLVLNDQINGDSVGNLITKAMALDKQASLLKGNEPVYLVLRTPGGEIQTGLELLEALKSLKRPVHTVTVFAASMGFQTVQQLGNRYIIRDGVLMSHRAKGSFDGEFGGQKISQIDNRKNFWEQRLSEMDKHTVSRTGGKQTLESYQHAYASEMWITGAQAIELGYADEMVHIRCDASLNGSEKHYVTMFGGEVVIEFELDKCPLNSTPKNVHVLSILTTKGVLTLKDFQDRNGGFGPACFQALGINPNVVCASDITFTSETLNKVKVDFVNSYVNIKERVLPLNLGK